MVDQRQTGAELPVDWVEANTTISIAQNSIGISLTPNLSDHIPGFHQIVISNVVSNFISLIFEEPLQ